MWIYFKYAIVADKVIIIVINRISMNLKFFKKKDVILLSPTT